MTIATDETQEAVAVREVITAHSVFPTCVCLVGLALFDLLEDSETHNGSTGLLLSSAGEISPRPDKPNGDTGGLTLSHTSEPSVGGEAW